MQADTLTFDQVHLGVPNPAEGARWYIQYLGAMPGEHTDRVTFGPTRFIFLKNDSPSPSHGSTIDHVGFSVDDMRGTVQLLVDEGVRSTSPACIEDPWGTTVEFVQDAGITGFHHVHLQVPDPDEARRWYLDMFGGSAEQIDGQEPALRYQDVRIFMDRGTASKSAGHAIDHVGWRMPDLLGKAAALKNKGVRFTTEPHAGPHAPHAPVLMSFMEDPWGVKIELLQRREP